MADGAGDPARSITIHSSWSGIAFAFGGAVLLLAISIVALTANGANWFTIILLIVAVIGVAVVFFDLPIASEFTRDGVTRRNLLRHHHMPWERITRLERARVGVMRTQRKTVGGGLLAGIGQRKYVLVDKLESALEFDALVRVLGSDLAARLSLEESLRPPDDRSPTWLYRRDKWKPASARS